VEKNLQELRGNDPKITSVILVIVVFRPIELAEALKKEHFFITSST